ncbi:MAG: long-chain fatty acid--CoA ligase [Deltaproteobacteria bacterium HGW-Deltaproteobacteria-15]|jgi:acyl-CoA synthetase (AMP-forming)/AMP-acid ligase II|nr:MAG: long-chain fatty acid--CoA ligase [Deltaproteobacteria bacterium HGW-Deltaproteobacteria-15]
MSKEYILKELARYRVGTYADIINRNGLLYPEEIAFKCGPEQVSFSGFNSRVNRLIHALRSLGVKKGEVVGVLSWNCLEYTDVYGAAMKGGYIASPYNARLQSGELEYLINYSDASTIFVGPELVEIIRSLRSRLPKVRNFISFKGSFPGMISYDELVSSSSSEEPDVFVEEEDPVFLFYTSGTTGVPRGALYTQKRAMDDTRRFAIAMALEFGRKQIQIMPLFHVGGTKNLWGYYFAGATNVITPKISFDPGATLQAIQDEKATDIHIVATHLAAFLALPDIDRYDLSSLKCMFYAASPMPLETLKRGMEKWGPIFMQFYGATEDGPNVTMLSKAQHRVLDRSAEEQKTLSSAGFPHIGVQVRIVGQDDRDVGPGEVGELIVRSKGTMQEWWHKPDDTRETIVDGWVHTGDLGRYDEKGFIYIVDRKKDMIVSGGENIFPREIEEVLYGHPSVLEASVFGIPDPYWVEKVHAVVVLKKGAAATEQELIDFCKQKLARFKAPKSVEVRESLPKNAAGKILKREMREKYWAGLERRV